MMERQLLLLGLLRSQEMHGYQINDLIDTHLGLSVRLKKPTVYKILSDMERNGWISSREEQEGNYPTRRVYAITKDGESAFLDILRDNISSFRSGSYLGNIGIVFIDALESTEVKSMLARRRKQVEEMAKDLHKHQQDMPTYSLMYTYHRHHLLAELNWLDETLDQLKSYSTGSY